MGFLYTWVQTVQSITREQLLHFRYWGDRMNKIEALLQTACQVLNGSPATNSADTYIRGKAEV